MTSTSAVQLSPKIAPKQHINKTSAATVWDRFRSVRFHHRRFDTFPRAFKSLGEEEACIRPPPDNASSPRIRLVSLPHLRAF